MTNHPRSKSKLGAPPPHRARRVGKLPPASADDLPRDLLDRPALEGARWLALLRLEQLRAAHERLADADHGEEEALHRFRVALRRLRSSLRELREPLRDSVSRKARRRLSGLAEAAGARRDLDVHLAWLGAERATLAEHECAGADQLEHALRREWREADAELRRELARDYDRVIHRLERRLRRYRLTIELGEQRALVDTRAMLGATIHRLGEELGAALGRLRGLDDDRAIHRARIAAKRLRYALEPLAARAWRLRSVSRAAGEIIAELKEIQESLGQIHDAHVLGGWLADRTAEAAAREARLGATVDANTGVLRPAEDSELAPVVRTLQQRLYDGAADRWRVLSSEGGKLRLARLVERARDVAEQLSAR